MKAHYAFTVQKNQKNLHRQLAASPWQKASARLYDRTDAHRRLAACVVQNLTTTDLGVAFPHAVQVTRTVSQSSRPAA
ncbi:hypothetical protein ACFWJ5_09300 [Streptomyces qaidamensis]|uniref:hypothetical protein n=1 Tax=Streptomyces qaidamensis TaxID=1783515 RepID=UPI0036643FF8